MIEKEYGLIENCVRSKVSAGGASARVIGNATSRQQAAWTCDGESSWRRLGQTSRQLQMASMRLYRSSYWDQIARYMEHISCGMRCFFSESCAVCAAGQLRTSSAKAQVPTDTRYQSSKRPAFLT